VLPELREGSLDGVVGVRDPVDDRRFPTGGLVQPPVRASAVPRDPGQHLPPVQLHELFTDVDHVERQDVRGVVGPFDGEIGERDEERELVRGDESAFREDPLNLDEEINLRFRIGDHPLTAP
jgi:hypothetical protein